MTFVMFLSPFFFFWLKQAQRIKNLIVLPQN